MYFVPSLLHLIPFRSNPYSCRPSLFASPFFTNIRQTYVQFNSWVTIKNRLTGVKLVDLLFPRNMGYTYQSPFHPPRSSRKRTSKKQKKLMEIQVMPFPWSWAVSFLSLYSRWRPSFSEVGRVWARFERSLGNGLISVKLGKGWGRGRGRVGYYLDTWSTCLGFFGGVGSLWIALWRAFW